MISFFYTYRGILKKEEKLIFLKKLFTQPVRTITTTELENKMQNKFTVLLDVRTAQEYMGGILREHDFFHLIGFIPMRVKKISLFILSVTLEHAVSVPQKS